MYHRLMVHIKYSFIYKLNRNEYKNNNVFYSKEILLGKDHMLNISYFNNIKHFTYWKVNRRFVLRLFNTNQWIVLSFKRCIEWFTFLLMQKEIGRRHRKSNSTVDGTYFRLGRYQMNFHLIKWMAFRNYSTWGYQIRI